MKASVVLPVYNKAPWLKECLDSVLAQSYGDFELIVVDDASTDDSAKILAAQDDPRMRVITLERNLGPGLAAQRAIDEARGEYLLRVDADDVLLTDRFQAQIAFLEAHPNIGALGAAVQLIGDGNSIRTRPLDPSACKAELLFMVAMFQPTMSMRRSVIVEHGIRYRAEWPCVGEDWRYQIELAQVTELANLHRVLVRYRSQGQGISQARDRAADLATSHAHVLDRFGVDPAPGQEDLRIHAMALKVFGQAPDKEDLRAFKDRMERIVTWNEGSRVFDRRALQARTDRAWKELLYHLPQFGKRITWEYLRMGGGVSLPRLYYLLRVFLSRTPPVRWSPA